MQRPGEGGALAVLVPLLAGPDPYNEPGSVKVEGAHSQATPSRQGQRTFSMVRYSTTAERASLLRARADSSQTQQCTPRRPEKIQMICLNPKSSARARRVGRQVSLLQGGTTG